MIVLGDNAGGDDNAATSPPALHPTITGYQGLGDGYGHTPAYHVPTPVAVDDVSGVWRKPWSLRLHSVVIAMLSFSLLVTVMTLATRSWGTGTQSGMSAGIFEVCFSRAEKDEYHNECWGWAEFCPQALSGMRCVVAAVIISLLVNIAMLACDIHEMLRPKTFRLHQQTMAVLAHSLWFFLLVSWTVYAGAFSVSCDSPEAQMNGGSGKFRVAVRMAFGWGWFFMILLFLMQGLLAIMLTAKLMGWPLFFGL